MPLDRKYILLQKVASPSLRLCVGYFFHDNDSHSDKVHKIDIYLYTTTATLGIHNHNYYYHRQQ